MDTIPGRSGEGGSGQGHVPVVGNALDDHGVRTDIVGIGKGGHAKGV